jgi:hypothetical protein
MTLFPEYSKSMKGVGLVDAHALNGHGHMHTQGGKMASRRALHFVFKVADRTATAAFYRETLGMKVSMSLLKLYGYSQKV